MLRRVFLLMLAAVFLAAPAVAQQPTFKSQSQIVVLHVAVQSGREFVGGLEQTAFTILEDGSPQPIAFFNNQDERTITVETPADAERSKAAQAEVRDADAALREARAAKDDAAIQRAKERVAASKQAEKSVAPTTMVLAERKTPRPSSIFIKGDFTRPSDPVSPNTPAVIIPPARMAPLGGSVRMSGASVPIIGTAKASNHQSPATRTVLRAAAT